MPEITRAQFVKGAVGGAFGLIALGVAGCSAGTSAKPGGSATPVRGGIAKMSVSGASANESLDPAISSQVSAIALCSMVYEMLVEPDNDFNLHPMLATSWESTDATKWTFHLRPDVTFHDGSPLTAEDVVFSIRRLLDEKVGSPLFGRLSPILKANDITKVDDATVELKLQSADAHLPLLLGQRTAAIVKAGTTAFTTGTAQGTGPFKIDRFTPGQEWSVKRNDAYWQKGLPYLDGVQCNAVAEQATKVQTVVSGDAHVCDAIDFSTAARLKDQAGVELARLRDALILNIVMDSSQKPFDDPKVVKAIKLAVDRDQVQKLAYRGFGSLAADTPAPTSDPFYPAALGTPARDVAAAKQLLTEAGHPDGIDLELFTTQATGGMVDLAVTFAKSVEEAGIRVKITQRPVDTYFSDVWMKKPFYTNYWGRRQTGESISVAYVSDAPWNETRMSSPALDTAMTEYRSTTDEKVQTAKLNEALEIISKEGSTVIPVFVDSVWLSKSGISGLQLNSDRAVLFHKAFLS